MILKTFPRLSETFILNEILELEAQGAKLCIYSLVRSGDFLMHEDVAEVQADVTYLSEMHMRSVAQILRDHLIILAQHPWRYLKAVLRRFRSNTARERFTQAIFLAARLSRQGICHVHAHFALEPTDLACWVDSLTGIPFSFTCHATDVYSEGRLNSLPFHSHLRAAAFAVVVSMQTKRDILSAWPDVPREKLHVFYNGLDLARFQSRPFELREPLLVGVGRLVEKKGFAYLIEACQLLKRRGVPFQCAIIGAGILQEGLTHLTFALGLDDQVRLLGPLPQEELLTYYHKAALVCLPAVVATNGNRDILPNVLKEAMAIGVPVVTTDLPGIEELIEHGRTGWLVSQHDPWALAEALEQLLTDRELARRLADR